MTRAENVEHWRGVVSELKNSGLSGAAFCRQRGLNLKQMCRWKRRFSTDEDAGRDDAGFMELITPDAPHSTSSGISIEIKGGICIRLARGFDVATLRAVLLAVREMAA